MRKSFNIIYGILVAICAMLIVSCGSQKKLTDTAGSGVETSAVTVKKVLEAVQANNVNVEALTAKARVKVALGGQDVSTSGTLRMKRGEVIQISLVDPILGITEVARMEFSKEKVLVIDRLNRRYVEEPYSKVAFLQKANVDFNTLQSVFWNEMFQAGESSVNPSKFVCGEIMADKTRLDYSDRLLKYSFTADRIRGVLTKTEAFAVANSTYSFAVDYSDFQTLKGKSFPADMQLAFKAGGKTLSLSLDLSSLKENGDWDAHTAVSKRYEKVDAEKILKILVAGQ